jgi:hypothetical protein
MSTIQPESRQGDQFTIAYEDTGVVVMGNGINTVAAKKCLEQIQLSVVVCGAWTTEDVGNLLESQSRVMQVRLREVLDAEAVRMLEELRRNRHLWDCEVAEPKVDRHVQRQQNRHHQFANARTHHSQILDRRSAPRWSARRWKAKT